MWTHAVEVPAYLVLQAMHPAVVVDAAVEAVVEEAVEDVVEETVEAEEDVVEETVEAEEDAAEETVEAVAEDVAEEVAEEEVVEDVAEEVVEVEVDVPAPAVEEVVVEEDAKDQVVEEVNLLATQHPQAMDMQRVPVEVHMLIQQVDMHLQVAILFHLRTPIWEGNWYILVYYEVGTVQCPNRGSERAFPLRQEKEPAT
ncbi:unnamed protein product [Nippostrongylus brasiliensis]|uniref:Fibrous sheath CABYR-binding protein-like n=1 Tax=Nippostrongylus brasiliensis TaxID=27835 RepID=A0A0N4Y527_NIPBR|nr:unnamed protein product [Nippostrongylus brasiliensis]